MPDTVPVQSDGSVPYFHGTDSSRSVLRVTRRFIFPTATVSLKQERINIHPPAAPREMDFIKPEEAIYNVL